MENEVGGNTGTIGFFFFFAFSPTQDIDLLNQLRELFAG